MNSKKTYIRATVTASAEAEDGLSNFFLEQGATGVQSEKGKVIGYFDEGCDESLLSTALSTYVQQCRAMGFDLCDAEVLRLPVEDWSVGWKQYFKPVRAGAHFIVKPPWEAWDAAEGEIVIDINPALAFGTGTHETTRLVMTLMESALKPGMAVLDAGTGSAVLAIGAVKLGASSVTGFDVDADALTNARENTQLNGVEAQIDLLCGTLENIQPAPYDIIFANINRRVLETVVPALRAYMTPETPLLVSGLLDTDRAAMEAIFAACNYEIETVLQEGEWMGYRLRLAVE